jgi:hypothetical protein
MSEFTYGNIIRSEDKDRLVPHLPPSTPTLRLSEEWFAFFTPNDGESMASKQVEHWSMHCPILYFTFLEDHGWSYDIFNNGEVVSNLKVVYGMTEEEAKALMEEFGENVLAGYLNQNPDAEAFRLFGLGDDRIDAIRALLSSLSSGEANEFEAAESFKELLGIEEMSWIRFERVENHEEIEYW